MKNKKTLAVFVSMALVCALSVAGTLAYLTATTADVKNTFAAAGLIDDADFDLKEHQAVADDANIGTYTLNTTEVTANTYSKVVPGVNIPKDPFVRMNDLLAPAYLFVEVSDTTPDTLTWAIDDANWTALAGATPKTAGATVYVYTGTAATNSVLPAAASLSTVNIIKNQEVEVANTYEGGADEALTFKAYLMQAAGFDTAAQAWAAL